MTELRKFTVAATNYKARTETFNGREHIVVPVIALVEGVVHAMNAANPELVSAEEFSRAPAGWNGRPIFHGHPMREGHPVSGNSPDVLESERVGTIFNSRVSNSKLKMEAWIDVERAAEVAPELLERIKDNASIEISVGAFVETEVKSGSFNGKTYKGEWHDIVPDHLALLPEGSEGACSINMGCGVRAAKGAVAMTEKKNTSVFSRILDLFRDTQSADQMSDGDLRRKLSEALRETDHNFNYVETYYPVTAPNRVVYSTYEGNSYELYERGFELAENGVVTLNEVAIEVEPVITYEPVPLEEPTAAAGKRNSSRDQVKIQAMHDHAVYLGAGCAPTTAENAAAGAPCSCQDKTPAVNNKGDKDMTKDQITAFLESATEEQLQAMTAIAEGKEAPKAAEVKAEETPKAEVKAEETPKAAEAKPVTFAEILETADPEVRDSINEGLRVGREKKAATIKALKDTGRCDLSDERLGKMNQVELDQMVKLAGSNVRAAIDFSGAGGPKEEQKAETVPAAPDLTAALQARAAKK